ncbi:hypothetical protein MOQ72_26865 [Saccharopolyspora sp. K220]|uniref:hypothetical protein n=1 Tax=Saccharopolyspora soli TaxID=2926618 RepID=UPI001F59EBDF|nr:hypothetical protein [Saccharopolyspora soli]MCI2421071.1 hypothetical protein [Saccharopolyspora soli]
MRAFTQYQLHQDLRTDIVDLSLPRSLDRGQRDALHALRAAVRSWATAADETDAPGEDEHAEPS